LKPIFQIENAKEAGRLSTARLIVARLTSARLSAARLSVARLSAALLSDVLLSGVWLRAARLSTARLSAARLGTVRLRILKFILKYDEFIFRKTFIYEKPIAKHYLVGFWWGKRRCFSISELKGVSYYFLLKVRSSFRI